jgi:hypothetical protein
VVIFRSLLLNIYRKKDNAKMWRYKFTALLLILGLMLAACSAEAQNQPSNRTGSVTPMPTDQPVIPSSSVAELTIETVKNSEYQLNAASQPRRVKLVEGAYESGSGADFVSVQLSDFFALGDLNTDNQQDAVAVAGENYGGSGVFTYLAVFMNQPGKPFHQFSALIDDRAQVEGLNIEDGKIVLDAVVHGMDDPMCCPSFQSRGLTRLPRAD